MADPHQMSEQIGSDHLKFRLYTTNVAGSHEIAVKCGDIDPSLLGMLGGKIRFDKKFVLNVREII